MKKNIIGQVVVSLVISAVFTWAGIAKAEESQALKQTVRLEVGWNLISVPRPVASHVFSASEISENFDIYILDATMPNNWTTMAGLGQTEFMPLYGYFIKNKTNHFQTLTFNYKDNLAPNERLLERKFTRAGWYSFAPAHTDYGWVGSQCSVAFDYIKTTDILKTLSGKYSQIVHFANNVGASAENYSFGSQLYSYREDQVDGVMMGPYAVGNMSELYGYAIYISADQANLDGVVTGNFLQSTCPNYVFFGTRDYTINDFARGSEENKIARFESNPNWSRATEGYDLSSFTIKTAEQFPIKNLHFKIELEYGGMDTSRYIAVNQVIADPTSNTEYVINLDEPIRIASYDNLKIEVYGDIAPDAPNLQDFSLVYLKEAQAVSLTNGIEKKLSNSFDQEFFPAVQSIASQKIDIVDTVNSDFGTVTPDGLKLAVDVSLQGSETDVAKFFFTSSNETGYVKDITFRLFGDDEVLNKISKVQIKHPSDRSVLSEESLVKDDVGYKVKFTKRTDGTLTDLGLNLWVQQGVLDTSNYIISAVTEDDFLPDSMLNMKMIDYTMFGLASDRDWTAKNESGFPVEGRVGASLQQDPI